MFLRFGAPNAVVCALLVSSCGVGGSLEVNAADDVDIDIAGEVRLGPGLIFVVGPRFGFGFGLGVGARAWIGTELVLTLPGLGLVASKTVKKDSHSPLPTGK